MLLWEEYREANGNANAYGYSRFCELYQRWRCKLDVVLRQDHKPGEKMFVDWAGATIPLHDRHTGQVWQAALFGAALGGQQLPPGRSDARSADGSRLRAHVHAFEYFKGIPALVVPDNTKTGVRQGASL